MSLSTRAVSTLSPYQTVSDRIKKSDRYMFALLAIFCLGGILAAVLGWGGAHFVNDSLYKFSLLCLVPGGAAAAVVSLLAGGLYLFFRPRLPQLTIPNIEMNKERLEKAEEIKKGLEAWAFYSLPEQRKKEIAQAILDCFCKQTTSLDLKAYSGVFLLNLPSEIGELTHLRKLVVSNLGLTALPPEIGKLTQLTYLQANNNLLSELPKEIGSLTHLKTLLLYHNRLDSLPIEIGSLVNLETLNLGQNRLTDLPPEMENLTQLKSLGLMINELTAFPVELVRNLPELKSVLFWQNPLDEIPEEIFSLPSSLKIGLDGIYFSEETISHLEERKENGPRISYTEREKLEQEDNEKIDKCLIALAQNAQKPKIVLFHLKGNHSFKGWLSRLELIGDYAKRRHVIALLIDGAIRQAEADSKYRATFLASIKGAADTCGDRMALSLLYLDIHIQIDKAKEEKDWAQLAYLIGHGSWTLGILGNIAHTKIKSTPEDLDEVEVYLAYPVHLKEALKIPITLNSMLFKACAKLEEKELKEAKKFVRSQLSDRQAYCTILAQDGEWEQVLRHALPNEMADLREKRERALEASEIEEQSTIQETYLKEVVQLTDSFLSEIGFSLPFST